MIDAVLREGAQSVRYGERIRAGCATIPSVSWFSILVLLVV